VLVRVVFFTCTLLIKELVDKPLATDMNHKIHTTKMPKANQPKVDFHNDPSASRFASTPKKKHISYNKYDERVIETEQRLMKKFNCGYSSLHKLLVLKEGTVQFSTPYL
tara:strand:+ start:125 stop:451 length:327 start_codon:yes stop_codon:yes gene_type:complete